MREDRRPRRGRLDEALVRLAARTSAALASLLRPGSLVILVFAAAFGVGTLMKESEFPHRATWEAGEPASLALLACGIVTYAGTILLVIGYRRTLRRSEQEAQLYRACRDVASLVEASTSLGRDAIGVHVWAGRGLPGLRRLERQATFVPGDRQPTAIVWRKHKGVIGRCWARDEWVLADLERLRASAGDEDEFMRLPPEERFDFTWLELRATEHYKGVLAWPLHGGPEGAPRVVGCISIDVQEEGAAAQLDRFRVRSASVFSAHRALCEAVLR